MTKYLLLLIGGLCCCASGWYVNLDAVCGLDRPVSMHELITKNRPVEYSHELNALLREVKGLYPSLSQSYFTVMTTSQPKICAAHTQNLQNTGYAPVITISEDYYSTNRGSAYRRPILLWILAHELQHHVNNDLIYQSNNNPCGNFTRELLADKQAGYAVGCLTRVNIDFFDNLLPFLLDEHPNSQTHPPIYYRILAAKAGWIEAKLKGRKQYQHTDKTLYKKEVLASGTVIGGLTNKKGIFTGIGYAIFTDGDVYIGQFDEQKKHGKGIYIVNNNTNYVKALYLGNWVDDLRQGHGDHYTIAGKNYSGSWWKGNKMEKTTTEPGQDRDRDPHAND